MFQKKFDKYMILTLIAPLLYCSYYLVQGKFLIKGNSDAINVNIPYFVAVNEAVSTDIIPSWTRDVFTGSPLIGSPTLLWYPPNWIIFVVYKDYIPYAVTLLAWLHFIGVAWAAFIYCREISKSSYWAFVSALAYTFSLPVIYGLTVGISSYLAAFMFTPLSLYIIHTSTNRPRKLTLLYIALIIFALITGAFIQIAFYCIILIFLYSIFIGTCGRKNLQGDKKIVLYFFGGIALGILLSAPMILPMIAINSDMSRYVANTDIHSIYKYMVKGSPKLLWRLFTPNAFGHNILYPDHEMGGINYVESINAFCGIISLFLASYAFTIKRSPTVIFWSLVFFGTILISVTPLAYIHLALFGFKPIINRASFLLPLAIISLAAIGGQYIDIKGSILKKSVIFSWLWVLIIIGTVYGLPVGDYFKIEIVRSALFLLALIIGGIYLCKKYKYLWRVTVLCLVLIEVVWSGHLMTTIQEYPLMVEPKNYYTYGNPWNPFPIHKDSLEQYRVVLGGKLNEMPTNFADATRKANQGIFYGYMSPWGYCNAFSTRLSFLLTKLTGEGSFDGLGRIVYFNSYNQMDSSYSEFRADEFKPPLTMEKLCKVIRDDKYTLSLNDAANDNNWLNELITVPNFYEILCVKKPNSSFSKEVKDLVNKTTRYPANESFSNLKPSVQVRIKMLNRLLLEETYPQEAPKSLKHHNGYNRISDLTSVGYALDLSNGQWRVVEDYRETCLPRASLFYDYEFFSNKEEAAERLKIPDFPLKQKVILTSKFHIPVGPPDSNSSVKFIKNGNSNIILDVETRTSAILLLTDVFAKEWIAMVDSKLVEVMEGNVAFRAVYIPGGKHRVEFKYFPPKLLLSLLISLIAISICVVLIVRKK